MYDPEEALELDSSKVPNTDTEADNACDVVQAFSRQIASEQGGTEHVSFDPTEKGNDDGFDLDRGERVNCDPQGFQWTDQPRDDDGYAGY